MLTPQQLEQKYQQMLEGVSHLKEEILKLEQQMLKFEQPQKQPQITSAWMQSVTANQEIQSPRAAYQRHALQKERGALPQQRQQLVTCWLQQGQPQKLPAAYAGAIDKINERPKEEDLAKAREVPPAKFTKRKKREEIPTELLDNLFRDCSQLEIKDPQTVIVQKKITDDEITMFVIQENCLQRKITFNVFKDECTAVQDLLEEANIYPAQHPQVSLVTDASLRTNLVVEIPPRAKRAEDGNAAAEAPRDAAAKTPSTKHAEHRAVPQTPATPIDQEVSPTKHPAVDPNAKEEAPPEEERADCDIAREVAQAETKTPMKNRTEQVAVPQSPASPRAPRHSSTRNPALHVNSREAEEAVTAPQEEEAIDDIVAEVARAEVKILINAKPEERAVAEAHWSGMDSLVLPVAVALFNKNAAVEKAPKGDQTESDAAQTARVQTKTHKTEKNLAERAAVARAQTIPAKPTVSSMSTLDLRDKEETGPKEEQAQRYPVEQEARGEIENSANDFIGPTAIPLARALFKPHPRSQESQASTQADESFDCSDTSEVSSEEESDAPVVAQAGIKKAGMNNLDEPTMPAPVTPATPATPAAPVTPAAPAVPVAPAAPATPAPDSDREPKYLKGWMAICNFCRAHTLDFNYCTACKKKLPMNVKGVRAPAVPTNRNAAPNIPVQAQPRAQNNAVQRTVGQTQSQQREAKYAIGWMAICPFCGTHSFDFNYCMKCQKKLPSNVKPIPLSPEKRKLNISPKAVRWGIAGVDFMCYDFVKGILSFLPKSKHELIAIADNDMTLALEFSKYGIMKAYGNYYDLANDKDVGVVMIGTRNPAYTLMIAKFMLESGKHVLYERPLGMNFKQAHELIILARKNKLFLMEGLWRRSLPAYETLRQELAMKKIGEVKQVIIHGLKLDDYLLDPKKYRGSTVLDLAIYAIQFACMAFNYERPISVKAVGHKSTGIDVSFSAFLVFSKGKTATILIRGESQLSNEAFIIGSRGTIRLPDVWHPTVIELPNDTKVKPLPMSRSEIGFLRTGLGCEAIEVRECLKKGFTENPTVRHAHSLLLAEIEDELRKQIGSVYEEDKLVDV